jgi:hydrogenase-4 component B
MGSCSPSDALKNAIAQVEAPMALSLLWYGLGCLGIGVVGALAVLRLPWFIYVSAAAGAVGCAVLASAAGVWLTGASVTAKLPASTPIGAFELRSSTLGGLFLLLIGLVGIGIFVYSAAYTARLGGYPRQAASLALLNLTFAAMVIVVAAGTALTLLLAWEAMSILTYVLVTVEFDHPGRPQAAFLMLALSEVGFVLMAVAFALIGALAPGVDFASVAAHHLTAATAGSAFVLFFFGFGAKAGLVPLQGWLPEAHPAAPSHVSALLSAVVVKMAIYGLVLSATVLLGPPAAWWGYLAIAAGVVTAAYGILFSLLASDLKRALAYSTIENLGFMIAMLGVALVFAAAGQTLLAGMALLVVCLHALYHSLLKGALFLGAGSVDVATGIRDMDQLGGLAKRMRWTTPLFFIGAMGLAGIPPLNGFQSEWLGLQTLIRAHDLVNPGDRVYLAAAGTVLTLTFALAVTTYIRIVGGAFLGAPRTHFAREAREVPRAMVVGMAIPIVAAVAMALVPPLGIGAAAAAAQSASGAHGLLDVVLPPIFTHPDQFAPVVQLGGSFLSQIIPANGLVIVPTSLNFAFISPTYIFLTFVFVILVTAAVLRMLCKPGRRETPVWVGAVAQRTPTMQYTATAFTNPFRSIFGAVYRSQREVEADYQQAPFFIRGIRYTHRFVEPIDTYIYQPVVRAARWMSDRFAFVQGGSLSVYVLYLFVVFLIVLLLR